MDLHTPVLFPPADRRAHRTVPTLLWLHQPRPRRPAPHARVPDLPAHGPAFVTGHAPGSADGLHNDCPTGKIAHPTRRGAKAHAYRLRQDTGEHLRPYLCSCGCWHVGHVPGQVLRGRVTADEHYRRRAV